MQVQHKYRLFPLAEGVVVIAIIIIIIAVVVVVAIVTALVGNDS